MPESPERPRPDEYADFYGGYIAAVDGPLLETLEHDAGEWQALLATVPSSREGHRYTPGKWSIREVVGARCRRRTDVQHAGHGLRPRGPVALPLI